MTSTVVGLTIDARDALVVATFWARTLGRTVADGGDADHAAVDADPEIPGSRIGVHRVPEDKTVKNRLHLDLLTTDFDTELDRLTDLGAVPLNEVRAGGHHWVTLADPEGNEFDLVEG